MRKIIFILLLLVIASPILANLVEEWEIIQDDAEWDIRGGAGVTYYDNALWVIGGQKEAGIRYDDMWYSYNGIDWVQSTNIPATAVTHKAVAFGEYIYLIPLDTNDVYITNGVDWATLTLNAETTFTNEVVVLDDEIIALNENGSVYGSTDGISWTEKVATAPWVASYSGVSLLGFKCVVYDGYIWLTGGSIGNTRKDFIWKSADGITWTLVTESGGYTARYQHGFFEWNDNLWIVGGLTSNPIATSFYSADGETWTEDTELESALFYMGVIDTPNYPILLGGIKGDGDYTNDVILPREIVPTVTVTPTITETHTNTPTKTITTTRTPVTTATPTFTRTITLTDTLTATATITRTNTPYYTPTVTMTVTPIYTPFLRYVSTDSDGHQTGTRLEWTKYDENTAEYILTIRDNALEVEDTITYLNSDDESNYNYVLTKTLEHLRYFGNYNFTVQAQATHWPETYTSNTLTIIPGVTPSVSPTPLSYCLGVNSVSDNSDYATSSTTFEDSGVSVQFSTDKDNQDVLIMASFSAESDGGTAARLGSYRIVCDSDELQSVDRRYSGTDDTGIGGLIGIATSATSGIKTAKLQHKTNFSARPIKLTAVDMFVLPLASTDIEFNNDTQTLDSTGTTLASATYATAVEGSIVMPTEGKVLLGATFNTAIEGGTDTRTAQYKLVLNGTDVGLDIQRYLGSVDDVGMVTVMGISNTVAAGTYSYSLQHRTDNTLGVKTYNATLLALALADDQGSATGIQFGSTQFTDTDYNSTAMESYQSVTDTAVELTIGDSRLAKAFLFGTYNVRSADATGNTRTGGFRLNDNYGLASANYTRFLSGTNDTGAAVMFGLSALAENVHVGQLLHKTDNTSNPIETGNITFGLISTCVEPIPTATP